MSNRKGFTLVELSVVIVVIGIILGMATKGKDLMRIARIRGETVKLVQMQTAVSAYLAASNQFSYDDEGYYNLDNLKAFGYITEKSLENELDASSPWGLRDCAVNIDETFRLPKGGRGICFVGLSDDNSIMGELVCSFEKSFDDSNLLGGKGREIVGNNRENYTETQYNRCASVTNRDRYAYRLLQLR